MSSRLRYRRSKQSFLRQHLFLSFSLDVKKSTTSAWHLSFYRETIKRKPFCPKDAGNSSSFYWVLQQSISANERLLQKRIGISMMVINKPVICFCTKVRATVIENESSLWPIRIQDSVSSVFFLLSFLQYIVRKWLFPRLLVMALCQEKQQ